MFNRLLIILLLTALTAAAQSPRQRRDSSFSIVFTQIGDAALQSKIRPVSDQRMSVFYYYANQREIVAGKLAGSVPPGVNLHPLVRRNGKEKWEVQPAALRTSDRTSWKAEVKFGDQADAGASFEFRMVASREPLPIGTVSFDILTRNALSMSEILRVRRRVDGLSVWIPYIDNYPVYGNDMIDVKLQAPVVVRARGMPPDALIGVAVQPVRPWTDRRWIMDSTVMGNEGNITAHFGRLGLDEFHEFEVLAFVAWPDEFPPRTVGIPQAQWEQMEGRFLAKSRAVGVIRWEGEFKILEIDGKKVIPGLPIAADLQSDVYGAVSKPLNQSEKVWIICLPKGRDAWVAGWTDEVHKAGRWVVNAAQLAKEKQPREFDLLAVIASDDPTKVNPKDLRRWIYLTRRPLRSVRVVVGN